MYVFFCTLDFIGQACSFSSSFTYSNVIYTISKCQNWRGKIGYATFWCKKNCAKIFTGPLKMVSLNNTCTIHFICQRFDLRCFLWLWLYAILVFTSDRNPSAVSLEVWDFRVLIMNILRLFQCSCLTRTALAFKKPLSELSGKWCSHAVGLFWAFNIFSSYAEIKCMQGWWQIGVPQHNFGLWWLPLLCTELAGLNEVKIASPTGDCWVLWPGRCSSSGECLSVNPSLFSGLCVRTVAFLQLRGFPDRSLRSNELLPKEFVFLNHHFLTGEKKFQLLLLIVNEQTDSPWETNFTHCIPPSVGLRNVL